MKEFKSFYKEVAGNEGNKCHYNTRLDMYGCGCQHDCSYCYEVNGEYICEACMEEHRVSVDNIIQ